MASLDDLVRLVKEKFPEITSLQSEGCQARLRTAVHEGLFSGVINITPSYLGKSLQQSQLFRAEGNSLFKKKQHSSALNKYNQSVMSAGFPAGIDVSETSTESLALALALANRSAVLYQQARYRECLTDTKESLRCGYPSDQQYKVLDRAARVHQKLGDWTQAEQVFDKVLKSLDQSLLEQQSKGQWGRKVDQEMHICRKKAGTKLEIITGPSLPQTKSTNERYPCAAACLAVQISETVGQHAVASAPVSVGDVLLVENPYICVLHPEYFTTHCYQCLQAAPIPVPCRQCTAVRYCSPSCAQLSWDMYHSVECQYMEWLSHRYLSKLGHAALRAVLRAGKVVLDGPPTEVTSEGSQYLEFCGLVTHNCKRDAESSVQLLTMSFHLYEVLRSAGYWKSLRPDRDLDRVEVKLTLCSHILHALQVVQCNGIAVTEMVNTEDFSRCTPQDIGLGVYLTASRLNHSCDPSADLGFYGQTCVARCIRDLTPGEEISIDYGPVFHTMRKPERQSHLKLNYFFNCQCRACEDNWPLFSSINSTCLVFKCQECSSPISDKSLELEKCHKCSKALSIRESLEELSRSHSAYTGAHSEVMRGNLHAALPALQSHLRLMQRLICAPWREFYSCQATVAQCYRIMATLYGVKARGSR